MAKISFDPNRPGSRVGQQSLSELFNVRVPNMTGLSHVPPSLTPTNPHPYSAVASSGSLSYGPPPAMMYPNASTPVDNLMPYKPVFEGPVQEEPQPSLLSSVSNFLGSPAAKGLAGLAYRAFGFQQRLSAAKALRRAGRQAEAQGEIEALRAETAAIVAASKFLT